MLTLLMLEARPRRTTAVGNERRRERERENDGRRRKAKKKVKIREKSKQHNKNDKKTTTYLVACPSPPCRRRHPLASVSYPSFVYCRWCWCDRCHCCCYHLRLQQHHQHHHHQYY